MFSIFERLFSGEGLMPHGHCYLWNPTLVWLHVLSDGLTGVAYTTIPFSLLYFVRRRRDLPFDTVFVLFGLFIVACGATHYLEIVTLWSPVYWLSGAVKALTAALSLATAVTVIRTIPRALAIPTTAELRRANQRADEAGLLATIVASSEDAILSVSLDGRIESWNAGATRLYGYRSEETVGARRWQDFAPPERAGEIPDLLARVGGGESFQSLETERVGRDGALVEVAVSVAPLRGVGGAITGASIIARDITARNRADRQLKASLREQQVLLKEVNHRVKNNLQVISSLLNLQGSHTTDPGALQVIRATQGRIRSIALFHDGIHDFKQQESVDMSGYLGHLLGTIRATFSGYESVVATLVVDEVIRLPADAAIPCALLANELITNAYEHAFPGGAGGVEVELRRAGAEALELRVSDDGVGFPAGLVPAAATTLGLQLVCTLAEQIGGTLALARRPKGTVLTVSFPANG